MTPKLPNYIVNKQLFDGATEYEHYTVIDSVYNSRPARILYTDNQAAAQSGLPFDGKPEMLFDYNERFMEIIGSLRPKSMLVLGGGAFTLPMTIRTAFPDIEVDVYELDGGLINIGERFFGLKQDKNLRIYIGDGRDLLRRSNSKYDLIIVDVFNSTDIPEEFNQPALPKELKDRLKSNGVVAMNVIAAYHGSRAEVLKSIEKSFKESFKDVKVFPAGSAISLWMSQNFIIVSGSQLKKITEALSYRPI